MKKYYQSVNPRMAIINIIFLALLLIPLNIIPDEIGYFQTTANGEIFIPIIKQPLGGAYIMLWTVWGCVVAGINIANLILRRWVKATIILDILARAFAAAILVYMGYTEASIVTPIEWKMFRWVLFASGAIVLYFASRRSRYYRALMEQES